MKVLLVGSTLATVSAIKALFFFDSEESCKAPRIDTDENELILSLMAAENEDELFHMAAISKWIDPRFLQMATLPEAPFYGFFGDCKLDEAGVKAYPDRAVTYVGEEYGSFITAANITLFAIDPSDPNGATNITSLTDSPTQFESYIDDKGVQFNGGLNLFVESNSYCERSPIVTQVDKVGTAFKFTVLTAPPGQLTFSRERVLNPRDDTFYKSGSYENCKGVVLSDDKNSAVQLYSRVSNMATLCADQDYEQYVLAMKGEGEVDRSPTTVELFCLSVALSDLKDQLIVQPGGDKGGNGDSTPELGAAVAVAAASVATLLAVSRRI